MSIYVEELRNLILYKKPFFIPINETDKKKGSAVFLLTPDYESSKKTMNLPYIINKRNFQSYYLEKDITYYINQESNCLIRRYEEIVQSINESEMIEESINMDNIIKAVIVGSISFTYPALGAVIGISILGSKLIKMNLRDTTYKDKRPQSSLYTKSSVEKTYMEIVSEGELIKYIKQLNAEPVTKEDKHHIMLAKGLIIPLKEKKPDSDGVAVINSFKDPYDEKEYVVLRIDDGYSTYRSFILAKGKGSKKNSVYLITIWNREGGDYNTVEIKSKAPKEEIDDTIDFKNTKAIVPLSSKNKQYKYSESTIIEENKTYTGKIYHASFTQGLNTIKPKTARSYKNLDNVVFGSPSKEVCVSSLYRDSDINVSRFNTNNPNNISIEITCKNSNTDFNKSFYLYEIENNNFKTLSDKDSYSELVSDIECKVLNVNKYDSWLDYMKKSNKVKLIGFNSIIEENVEYYPEYISEGYTMNETYLATADVMIFFNEMFDENVLHEANNGNNGMLKKLLYNERIRNNKEILNLYDNVKLDNPWITKTFIDLDRYNSLNLFVDLSYYNNTFLKNNLYKLDRGVNLYLDFINRFIEDKRITPAGYTKKTLFIPVTDLDYTEDSFIWDYKENLNPISIIYRLLKTDPNLITTVWKDYNVVFLGDSSYFKVDFNNFEVNDLPRFLTNIKSIINNEVVIDNEPKDIESTKAITANIVDKIEQSQKITINNLTGGTKEITQKELDLKINKSKEELDAQEDKKAELVQAIQKAAETSNTTDEAIDALEDDDHIKKILMDLAQDEEDSVKINNSRAARINDLSDGFMQKKIKNTTVKQLLTSRGTKKPLAETALPVDSINEEWKHMTYMNFEKSYSLEEDIVAILHSFSTKTVPISIRNIDVVDNSTSEDFIETYTVECEDVLGQRFTLKFDIPRLKRNRFMRLRGNEKTINGQLVLFPIIKTDEDTVQVVSNYNKIFISRFGTNSGKSYVIADRLVKSFGKLEDSKDIKFLYGDNNKISSKYELPLDYMDLATLYSKIILKDITIYFNQDELRSMFKVDDTKGIPVGIDTKENKLIYWNGSISITFSEYLYSLMQTRVTGFDGIYNITKPATKYTYSKASILNTDIPVIVIMAYNEGLQSALKKANVEYEFAEKKIIADNYTDFIKFSDGYLIYTLNYNSSLLLNALKECATDEYSIKDINSKTMWVSFLDNYGGRIKADGLDNFYDLMMDPITVEVCEDLGLPTDYTEVLAYANMLLADNKYNRHVDITGNRMRTNEIIAGYTYKVLADSYAEYRNQLKRNRKGNTMTVKQTEVIDRLMMDSMSSDLSDLNDLLNLETANTVSFKGLSGMNSDRSYGLDKRTFDASMLNVLAMSTGFAGNVGLVRQTTIDMNIEGKRGYIKPTTDLNNMNVAKTLCMAEALTPFGTTSDDPFRSAMTFTQTVKHGMRTKISSPLLISNGADEALPYLTADTFAHKAKQAGKIIEKTDEYLVVQYKDGTSEFVDLRENVKKNSDGGFYITIKLDSDLKVGSTVKEMQIIAYDKLSYTKDMGPNDNIAYNLGVLCKIGILNTDEGYEDSAIISEWLSDAMSSEVVVKKEVLLPKNANIYNMVKKGQDIQEGEPLITFQNAFDEDDLNILLKNLTDEEDAVSELGRIPIKSKITGVVQDITILRTIEKPEMSSSLKAKVNEYDKDVKKLKDIMEKYDPDAAKVFTPNYKLEATGKLKHAQEAVLVEFYLKYNDKLSIGDKIVYYSALKGVVKDIFPKGKEPFSDYRPKEQLDSLLSQESIDGRMVDSILKSGAINKGLIELTRQAQDIMGIEWTYLHE